MGLEGGGGTALSTLHAYQQNTHYALIGGSIVGAWDDNATTSGQHDADGTSVLPGGVLDFLADALASGNPYATAYSYDPSVDLDEIQDRITQVIDIVDGLDPATDFSSYLTQALSSVDTLISSTHIDDTVDAFETKTSPAFARSVNRLTAPLATNNATGGSAFVVGMSLLERQRIAELDEYRAQLNSRKQDQRAQLGMQFVSEMSAMQGRLLQMNQVAATLQHEASRSKIVANKEFLAEELDLDYKDSTYELELFGYANATLAAGLGAPSRPIGPSKASTQLSSALTAATTVGAAAGALGPGPGLIGAGLAGAFTWFANG